jgi:trehalose synthase
MPVRTLSVAPGPRRLEALVPLAGDEAVAAVRDAAAALKGLRVVHLATPPFAPGALDLLRSTVPLLRDAGLDARWLAVAGDDRADAAARAVGDALRGGEPGPPADLDVWRERGAAAAAELPPGTDVVVVHGLEGLAALAGRGARGPRWIWWPDRDPVLPREEPWRSLQDLVQAADEVVSGLAAAIDPLAPRNVELPPRTAGILARGAGLDTTRPFVVQVADLDGWSELEEALAAVRAAREAGADGLQLAIAARLPAGDPRAWRTLGELADHAAGLDDVRIVTDAGGAGAAEVNALQRLARAAVQPRGGTAALEAGWKGTPVLDGDPAGAGVRVAELVADAGLAIELGRAAREAVRASGLITRHLLDELALYARISSER